jgi:hypothetical protein
MPLILNLAYPEKRHLDPKDWIRLRTLLVDSGRIQARWWLCEGATFPFHREQMSKPVEFKKVYAS